jgi:predicted RNA binding protein YcfA (HicA-like mRNA interferase family)
MSMYNKLLMQIVFGTQQANIRFSEICNLLKHLGFEERIKGSHHIFSMEGIDEIINIHPNGSDTKIYQIKQIRNLIIKYRLGEWENE